MPEFDPSSGITYGQYLRNKGIQVMPGGRTWVTRDQVTEGRTDDGARFKRTRDQLGHDVTERTDADGRTHRDVAINLRG